MTSCYSLPFFSSPESKPAIEDQRYKIRESQTDDIRGPIITKEVYLIVERLASPKYGNETVLTFHKREQGNQYSCWISGFMAAWAASQMRWHTGKDDMFIKIDDTVFTLKSAGSLAIYTLPVEVLSKLKNCTKLSIQFGTKSGPINIAEAAVVAIKQILE
jgi:hypothetical protein